ncbi:hypothetical protein TCDM_05272 [Trypanosoma cruzi Dm28c]|uniref:C3H1-type domain-containing protein n=2 Tax=Trypanosoma cruzi TaxID=5693 RepID=V5AZ55_TRYCR|nr:hypothetical protein TCDM_05272 [Trypanosoma cruzi Dm28c]PWU87219.1 hypothetical protein C4B63_97g14 [Trypanosoma cruzi]
MPSKGSAANTTTGSQLEVFDSNFKCLYTVPSHLVVHTPPARFNISRFVICRNYRCGEADSCPKGEGCRFVHADVDYSTLEGQPIHVNYIWRDEKLCIYERLPPGDVLEVLSRSGSEKPDLIPSERILVTRRALSYREDNSRRLSHCVHYYCNRMCNRGENCNFIHAVYVDPNVEGDFKRPPAQSMSQFNSSTRSSQTDASDSPLEWKSQMNSSLRSYGRLPSNKHFGSQVFPQTQSADSLPLNVAPQELGTFCMAASQSANEAVTSAPLNGSNMSFNKNNNSSVEYNKIFEDAHILRIERGTRGSGMGSFTPMSQTPMMSSLGLSYDSSGALPIPGEGAKNIPRVAYKTFEGSIGQGFLGSPCGFTVSPATPMQGAGNFSLSFTTPSPCQMPLNSPQETVLAACGGVITRNKAADRNSGHMDKLLRVYRHNPYKPIN